MPQLITAVETIYLIACFVEEELEAGRRWGRRQKPSGIHDVASSLHHSMVPSQAGDENLLSIPVSEMMAIFEWGTVHLT